MTVPPTTHTGQTTPVQRRSNRVSATAAARTRTDAAVSGHWLGTHNPLVAGSSPARPTEQPH